MTSWTNKGLASKHEMHGMLLEDGSLQRRMQGNDLDTPTLNAKRVRNYEMVHGQFRLERRPLLAPSRVIMHKFAPDFYHNHFAQRVTHRSILQISS